MILQELDSQIEEMSLRYVSPLIRWSSARTSSRDVSVPQRFFLPPPV